MSCPRLLEGRLPLSMGRYPDHSLSPTDTGDKRTFLPFMIFDNDCRVGGVTLAGAAIAPLFRRCGPRCKLRRRYSSSDRRRFVPSLSTAYQRRVTVASRHRLRNRRRFDAVLMNKSGLKSYNVEGRLLVKSRVVVRWARCRKDLWDKNPRREVPQVSSECGEV